jgi:preprotein translocase subunit SecD
MKKLIQSIAVCIIASLAVAADSSAAPVFQMRLVLDTPSGDSEPMTLITKNKNNTYTNVLNVQKTVLLDHTALKSAKPGADALGQPVIEIAFTDAGANRFAQVTRQNIHKRLAIIIDGQICEAPMIAMEVTGGTAQISGSFSKQEAKDLAGKINGALTKK